MRDTPREFADNSLIRIAIDWHRIAQGRDMDLRGRRASVGDPGEQSLLFNRFCHNGPWNSIHTLNYQITILGIKTIDEIEGAWTNTDYVELLKHLNFPDAKDAP
ncbi:MAG: hypothetical protein P1U87_00855 [Verrucomicrobiales bacterium]|nr:hypothetical protein [Verrucomicrobiales bacterium]